MPDPEHSPNFLPPIGVLSNEVDGEQSDTKVSPAETLLSVFGRRLVIVIAISSLVLAILLNFLSIFTPVYFVGPRAHDFVLLLMAFSFAVFLFALFPINLILNTEKLGLAGKLLPISANLMGPTALWLVLFIVLRSLMPDIPSGAKYTIEPAEPHLGANSTWVMEESWSPQKPREFYKLLLASDANGGAQDYIEGFFADFESDAGKFQVEIGIGTSPSNIYERYMVSFDTKTRLCTLSPK